MKVYLVTTGWYSDYSIAAVFTDKAMAERHRVQRTDANDVEEWPVIGSDDPQPHKVFVYAAAAEWFRNSEDEVRTWSFDAWSYDLHNHGLGGRKKVNITEGNAPAGHYIRAWSLDPRMATKAVADRRAKYLAELEGIVG
jgi:hypothetical protein